MDTCSFFPPCYVLTAPLGGDLRLRSAVAQLESLAIRHALVSGFSPESVAVDRSYSRIRNLLFMKRSLTRGEVAVYLGHRKIWQTIVERGDRYALVFEDDFRFVDPGTAATMIGRAARHLDRFDLIKLFDFRKREPLAAIADDGFEIAIHGRPNSGLVGYLVTADCCRKLLMRRHIFRPVDEELRYWFDFRIGIGSVEPNLVFDNGGELAGSLLDGEREKVRQKRKWLRSIYANFLAAYVGIRSWWWARRIVRLLKAPDRPREEPLPPGDPVMPPVIR